MKPRKSPATDEELVNAFMDLFNEIEPETEDEIDAILLQAGFDPKAVAVHMRQVADRAIEKSPLNWRNVVPAEFETEKARLTALRPRVHMSREVILEAIRNKVTRLGGKINQLGFAHRNFDIASDDDLRSLLSELDYLEVNQQTDKSED